MFTIPYQVEFTDSCENNNLYYWGQYYAEFGKVGYDPLEQWYEQETATFYEWGYTFYYHFDKAYIFGIEYACGDPTYDFFEISTDTGFPMSTVSVQENTYSFTKEMRILPYSASVIGTEEVGVTVTLEDPLGLNPTLQIQDSFLIRLICPSDPPTFTVVTAGQTQLAWDVVAITDTVYYLDQIQLHHNETACPYIMDNPHLHKRYYFNESDWGAWYTFEWVYGGQNIFTIHPWPNRLQYIGNHYEYAIAVDFNGGGLDLELPNTIVVTYFSSCSSTIIDPVQLSPMTALVGEVKS